MSVLDLVIVAMLCLGGLNGLRLGLVQALANFFGWLMALCLAWLSYENIAPSLDGLTDNPVLQQIYAFVGVVIVVMIVTWLLCAMLSKILHTLKLGMLNRLAGGVFGFAKSLLVVLIVIGTLHPLLQAQRFWQDAAVVQSLLPYAPWAKHMSKQVADQAIEHIRLEKESSSSGTESEVSGSPKSNPFY